ncbi:MAG: hypothetical protein ABIJ97_07865 [Bacteroidota bacterium]
MRYLFIFILITLKLSSVAQTSNWEPIGNGVNWGIKCFYEDTVEDKLYIGGNFTSVDTIQNVYCIAVLNNQTWETEISKLDHICSDITGYQNDIYAGGYFVYADTVKVNAVGRWDGNQWYPVGEGFGGGVIYNLKVINNELFACGCFDSSSINVVNSLAKWSGSEWVSVYNFPRFDSITPNYIFDIAYFNGEFYVAGNFGYSDMSVMDIVKYNGTEWVDVGGSMKGGMAAISRMEVYNNELIVAGMFWKQDGNTGNFIQAWDGTQWKELGGGVSGYMQLPNSNGQIHEMKINNGDLYVGGVFTYAGGVPAPHMARWDGTEWCGFGGNFNNNIYSFGFYRDTLYIGCGTMVDSIQVNNLARWVGGSHVDTCGAINSINETVYEDKSILVYPNPAQDEITIETSDINNEFFEISI